jgi:hypothetical protein
MQVKFFTRYPGGHDKDPGYAGFNVHAADGRRYAGHCDVDGTTLRMVRTAAPGSDKYRMLSAKQLVAFAATAEPLLVEYVKAIDAPAKQTKVQYMPYPSNYVALRSGSKVGWRTYATREDAEACAKAARHNARIQEEYGFDFGFQCPGEIREVAAGFEVTLP